jgi:hypothetical protein
MRGPAEPVFLGMRRLAFSAIHEEIAPDGRAEGHSFCPEVGRDGPWARAGLPAPKLLLTT